MQFNLSAEAGRMVRKFAKDSDLSADVPLRVDIIGGADSGYAYDVYFDDCRDDDIVVVCGTRKLLFSPDAAVYLDGSALDWVRSDNGSGFHIDNPNEPDKT